MKFDKDLDQSFSVKNADSVYANSKKSEGKPKINLAEFIGKRISPNDKKEIYINIDQTSIIQSPGGDMKKT